MEILNSLEQTLSDYSNILFTINAIAIFTISFISLYNKRDKKPKINTAFTYIITQNDIEASGRSITIINRNPYRLYYRDMYFDKNKRLNVYKKKSKAPILQSMLMTPISTEGYIEPFDTFSINIREDSCLKIRNSLKHKPYFRCTLNGKTYYKKIKL